MTIAVDLGRKATKTTTTYIVYMMMSIQRVYNEVSYIVYIMMH